MEQFRFVTAPGLDPVRAVESRRASTLELVVGNLTEESTDAIVTPSSLGLSGGGLVDLAVRRVAGPALAAACRMKVDAMRGAVLSPGQVVLTPGFGLPARFVMHCVPPIYAADPVTARDQLAACHTEALSLARLHRLSSISFPAIATGVCGYPVHEAAAVSIQTVARELTKHGAPLLVRFVLYGPVTLDQYRRAAQQYLGHGVARIAES